MKRAAAGGRKPNLYIIAGPNGAGKTTFARKFLPKYEKCMEFVNADLIAGGLSPFSPERAAIQAGRIMLEQIQTLSARRLDFAFETTLAGKSYVGFLKDLKAKGYHVHLVYLWLRDVKLALERIADRVRKGGHNIPEATVRRRFHKSLANFFDLYEPLMNAWTIFDNSSDKPKRIAYKEGGRLRIVDSEMFAGLLKEKGTHGKKK
jgi:predicted ABC-type ATPase